MKVLSDTFWTIVGIIVRIFQFIQSFKPSKKL